MPEDLESILRTLHTYVDACSTFSERSDEPLNFDECFAHILYRLNEAIEALKEQP